MKSLGFGSVALAISMIPIAAQAQGGPPAASAPAARPMASPQASVRNWGPRYHGRWIAGWRAPGGWAAYRPPVRGFLLPVYWINPGFYIGNYARYGFAPPAYGFGWSRYYDDAVLTDRDGRVIDTVPGFDWGRYDAYDDRGGAGYYAEDYSDSYGYRDDGVRPAPQGKASGHHEDHGREGGALPYDLGTRDRGDVTYQGRWTGTWTGHYEGQPTTVYNGTYDGRYEGSAPHWAYRNPRWQGGYYGVPAYGWGWGPPVITTVTYQSAPVVTTTTTEEWIYRTVSRKRLGRHVWKPRPKLRCAC